MSSDEKFVGQLPMKARGCPWEMWTGVIGISKKLVVFDGDVPVGDAGNLTERGRKALANYMIDLWTKFRDQ